MLTRARAQVLSALGAHVIGTTSTREKAALALANGAEHVLLYAGPEKQDVVAEVLRLTDGKGVHAVFDGVGKDTWEDDFKVIRLKGTIVFAGNASGPVPPFPPLKMSEKNSKVTRPTCARRCPAPLLRPLCAPLTCAQARAQYEGAGRGGRVGGAAVGARRARDGARGRVEGVCVLRGGHSAGRARHDGARELGQAAHQDRVRCRRALCITGLHVCRGARDNEITSFA